MRHFLWVLLTLISPGLVCFFWIPSALAGNRQRTPENSSAPPDLAELIATQETAVWEAARQKDVPAFRALVAEDARMIFTSGIKTRAEYVQSLPERDISKYALEDFHAYQPSPDTVITIYKATISGIFNGKRVPSFTVREASVWVRRGGKWVAVLNQETPIN